jgi:lactoylglutathione lyase
MGLPNAAKILNLKQMRTMDPKQNTNIQLAVPFFGVSDMDASLRFYIDGLGFSIEKKWEPRGTIEWCWIRRDAVALMLQEPNHNAVDDKDQKKIKGTGVSICFQCADALILYHEFSARGITMNEPFVGNNMWVVNIKDPDGYNIQFQSITDVPEETMYSAWYK